MEPNEDVRGVFLTDSKRTTQRSPTGSATGSVLERKSGKRIVLNDTSPALLKQIVRLQKHPIAATNTKRYGRFDDDQKRF